MKKKRNTPTAALPADTRTLPLHEAVATQAYILWEHYGQPAGNDVGVWLEAERQVLGTDRLVNQQPGGAVASRELAEALAPDLGELTPGSGVAPNRHR